MVDFQSRYRMYGHGYTSPVLKYPVPTHRELHHETAPKIFKRRPRAHDCRAEMIRENTMSTDWETMILAQGLNATCRSVDGMHFKDVEDRAKSPSQRAPDKLITSVGIRGSANGDFHYPRGLTTNMDGSILVADSSNHRIQIFNQFGVYIKRFGIKGKAPGEFDEPTGITELPNGDYAIADKNNKRVQVFSSDYKFKFEFETCENPFSISSDSQYNIVVSTTARTVEVYRRGGKLLHKFPLNGRGRIRCGYHICTNDKDEVVVCDTANAQVKFYTYDGRLLYKFEPSANSEGLAVVPSAICRTPLDQYIIADSLNHTVNLYTERGVLLKQLICPTDDAGAVQTCALGPEGHLVVTEFSVLGNHCLKIFRYRNCPCHRNRPGSSKRRTPTPLF